MNGWRALISRTAARLSSATLAAFALLCMLAAPSAFAIDESDLLPVDQAFALSAKAVDRGSIQISWNIAKGYYLYRERISAQPADAAFKADPLQLPEGIHKHDQFFGDVQIYHGLVSGTLTGTPASGVSAVDVTVKYQGCADAGVCYPPQKRTLHIVLPAQGSATIVTGAETSAPRPDSAAGQLAALTGHTTSGLPGTNTLPLPADQAFVFEAIVDTPNRLLLRFTPAKGYYLYRDKTTFAVSGSASSSVQPGKPNWPPAQQRHDEHFGDVAVYTNLVEVPLPIIRTTSNAQSVTLNVGFQGCQIDGICYPPMQRSVTLALPAGGSTLDAAANIGPGPLSPVDPSSQVGLLLSLVLALGGGLVLNLMPCVLPVLSLKVLSVMESGESLAKARRHALWYTAGTLVSFGSLGMMVVALQAAGLRWGFWLQEPSIVGLLAYLMFAFGLGLSGVFHIGAGVAGLGQKLTERSGPSGDFFTGVLAVVVASPCTAPFMGTAVAYAVTCPSAEALAIFLMLGLGLALPFLLIAFVPALASRLPKPGAWMETLKQLFAFPMYLTAAWLASVLAAQRGSAGILYLLGGSVILALGLWWWERSRYSRHRIVRPLATLVVLAALLPLLTIHDLPAVSKQQMEEGTVAYSAEALASLRSQNRVVFVDMTADWCVSCKANEAAVLSRPTFRNAMSAANAVYMVGDYTSVDPAITAFLDAHRAVGVPLYVVYPRGGGEGEVLPNILTQGIVGDALARASAH